jgi:hypothetical protein
MSKDSPAPGGSSGSSGSHVQQQDELMLLEKVIFRLASAETDQALTSAVNKFLPPCLLKLASHQEGVRKKVLELLTHLNKRIKDNPNVQLPMETLLVQYQVQQALLLLTLSVPIELCREFLGSCSNNFHHQFHNYLHSNGISKVARREAG